MADEPLSVEVQGTSIIVTMPGTDFSVTYEKRADTPNLVVTHSWVSPTITLPAVSEFRARAFQAAVAKARELSWIV
jgi:hypothetical protein